MARWSKNGFNQSFGNRLFIPTEDFWSQSSSRLNRATITNLEFFKWEELIDFEALLILDPPYIDRPTSYQTVSDSWFKKWINWLESSNNKHDIIYTDCEHHFLPTFNMEYLRQMANTSPNRNQQLNGHNEVIFTNIK